MLLHHLNTQTNSNLSFSFLTISQLIELAIKNKLNYLAIADYHPYEIVNFFSLCKINKIKPIWGTKIFLYEKKPEERKYSATIYPQNNKGYKEVFQKLFSSDSPNNRNFSLQYILSNLSENCLIVFEARKLEEIIYIGKELILNHSPKKEGSSNNLFIGFNFFLFSPTQNIPQNLIPFLIPFFSIKCLDDKDKKMLSLWKKTSFNRYFFTDEIREDFFSYSNTEEYFSHCTDDKSFYQLLLIQWQTFLTRINLNPSFGEKSKKIKKENPILVLKGKCWQKLIALKKEKNENYQKILEKELEVVEKLNYTDYFLTFSDITDHLKAEGIITGPGRGSSVSSLVVYLLGITSVDPLENKLFFERFLNEKRKNLPDIDLDVENQEEVFTYLQKKYPKKQVAHIITKKKIGWKNALRESGKLYKIGDLKLKEMISSVGEVPNFEDLKLKRWQISHPNLFQLANKIQNLYYDTGIHPAGVIINSSSLIGLIPLKSEKDYLLSLFEENDLAKLGLKKYDFLSLRETLGFIREVKEILQVDLPKYQEINLNDEKTWKLLKNFLLTGIFQLDTPSARTLFNRFNPQNFSELIVLLSLNRPGTRRKAEEVSQKKNTKIKTFSSNSIKEILGETYEAIIFEEQISQILAYVYDCSFAEAEVKRKEIIVKGLEKDFLSKAQKLMTITESNLVYQRINSSFGYTFNKSHAVAYAYLTYYVSYLKANFFSELITNFLNKKKDKELSYLQEAFFYGFQIRGADINYSEIEWIRKDKVLFMGFSNLKEYRNEFFQAIIEERKKNGIYKNWEDLINRTIKHWENIEIFSFELWVKSDLFKSLKVDIDLLINKKEEIFRYFSIRRRLTVINNSLPFLDFFSSEKIKKSNLIINQREIESLGLYMSYFSRWAELSSQKIYEISSFLDIFQKIDNDDKEKLINIYAIVYQLEKKDENNYIVTLQDVRNNFKLVISADFYLLNKGKLTIHNELLFTLKFRIKQGKINSLSCEKIIEIL